MKARCFVSFAVALLIGLLIGFYSPRSSRQDSSLTDDLSEHSSMSSLASTSRARENAKLASNVTTETLQDAWAQLMQLPAAEFNSDETRAKLHALLAEWILVDPRNCLRSWVKYARSMNGIYLFDAFREICQTDPEYLRNNMIKHLDGLDRGYALQNWVELMSRENCTELMKLFDSLGIAEKRKAVFMLYHSFQLTSTQRTQLVEKIANLPDSPVNRDLVQEMIRAEAILYVKDEIKNLSEVTTEGMLRYHSRRLIEAVRSERKSYRELQKILADLPEDARSMASKEIAMTDAPSAALLQVAIDQLRTTDDWESQAKQLAVALHYTTGQNPQPQESAEWALSLPQTSEFEDLYRVGVRSFANRQPAAYEQWIQQLPSGWQRDNASVEYVHSLMRDKANAELAEQILPTIQDPNFQKSAQQMIKDALAR
jgi:hypothetical protein